MALLDVDWEPFCSPNSELPQDIFFLVKGKDGKCSKFGAHRFLLAAISPYFRRMFFGPMLETKEEMEVKLDCNEDTSPEAFGALINYIYTRHPNDVMNGMCPVTLLELFALADMYDIPKLKTRILDEVEAEEYEINLENLISIATVANSYRGVYADISNKVLMLCLKFYFRLDATDKDALLESSDGILQELMEVGRSTLFPGNSFRKNLSAEH